jgi:hypothetical protein
VLFATFLSFILFFATPICPPFHYHLFVLSDYAFSPPANDQKKSAVRFFALSPLAIFSFLKIIKPKFQQE